jgi:eukaryotic-like serine/threonine-protein kinase
MAICRLCSTEHDPAATACPKQTGGTATGFAGADTQPAMASDLALAQTGIVAPSTPVAPGPDTEHGYADTVSPQAPAMAKTAARDPGLPSPDTTSDEIPVGTTIGYWTITRKLGEGGMGAVYAATAAEIGTTVAVKVLSFPGWRSPGARAHFEKAKERFRREAEAASKLKHPNVIAILAYGNLPDGRPYFVMEYLPGRPLDVRLQEDPPRGPELLRLLSQVCDALAAIHMEGIVHRDLKPENVWVVEPKQGETFAKLLDFGISKMEGASRLTDTGMHAGTPYYESPEQLDNKNIGPRSDVYSFGAVLYQIFTGEPLWSGQSVAKIFHDILFGEPPAMVARAPYAITPELERLVRDCLKKKPDERPQSALEVKARLRAALGGEDRAVAPPVTSQPPASTISRSQPQATVQESAIATADFAARVSGRGRTIAVATSLLILAAAVGLWATLRRPTPPSTPPNSPAPPVASPKPPTPIEAPTVAPPSPPLPGASEKAASGVSSPSPTSARRGSPRRALGAKSSSLSPLPAAVEATQPQRNTSELAPPPAPPAPSPPAAATAPPAEPTPPATPTSPRPSAEPARSGRAGHRPLLPQKPELIYKDLREEK